MTHGYPAVKHVVMDEVQSFRAEDGDWLKKARRLVGASSDDPGYLWLFIDNSQVYHQYKTGIPFENQQIPDFRLKKVIRNSKTIFEYSKKFVHENAASKIELGHDFPGDEVEHYCDSTEVYSRLKTVLESLFTEGYAEKDIAILFGKEESIPSDVRSSMNLSRTVDAEGDNSDCVVVSTLRKYSGLERPVVVLFLLRAMLPYLSPTKSSIYCGVTRAMVKLVVIDAAVYSTSSQQLL